MLDVPAQRLEAHEPRLDAGIFPPWLISMIAHMLAVIALALWSIQTPRELGTVLTLLPTSGDDDLSGAESLDVDVASTEPLGDELEFAEVEAVEPTVEPPLPAMVAAAAPASLGAFGAGLGAGVGAGERGEGPGDGAGEGLGRTRTSMFDLAGEGGKFVYVFDRSRSMSSVLTYDIDGDRSLSVTPLGAAKQELLRSLEDLDESHQFQIVFYNDEYSMFLNTPSLFVANYAHKQLASQFVEGMRAEAQTHHLPALNAAVACRPDVVFLLTDGEAKDELSPIEVKRLTRICKRQRTQVNVIQFCASPRSSSSLMQLAEATGGRHRFVTLVELAKLQEAKDAEQQAQKKL